MWFKCWQETYECMSLSYKQVDVLTWTYSWSSWVLRQLSPSFVQLHASIQIFLQLQCWLRHPFVQPHEVISLQSFGIGIAEKATVSLADRPDASIPFRSLVEDQDTANVLGSRHLLDSVNAWCETLLHLRLVAESLVYDWYKTTWLVLCCMYQPRERYISCRWFSLLI